ncbi:MAG: hypothetical protein KOO63_01355 [Bacteroidales bacterium]|nr:hypothetical protein [Candidatus Latescibacterota bacterium]
MAKKILIAAAVLLLVASGAMGQVGVGDEAPPFIYGSVSHGTVSLADHSGKVVYLYFYGYN